MLKRAEEFSSETMKCAGWGGGSKATYGRGDVEQVLLVEVEVLLVQVLLASRSLPEDDGGERVSSKPVGWIERFPLQVKQEKCDILNAYCK